LIIKWLKVARFFRDIHFRISLVISALQPSREIFYTRDFLENARARP